MTDNNIWGLAHVIILEKILKLINTHFLDEGVLKSFIRKVFAKHGVNVGL